jgi:hypothetical protein
MITVKSINPESIMGDFTVSYQTTASVGPAYFLIPYNAILKEAQFGMAIKTTSNRSFSIKNLANSVTYLNSAVYMGSGAVGYVTKVGLSASANLGPAFITQDTLLSVGWSASKGDVGFSLIFKHAAKGRAV